MMTVTKISIHPLEQRKSLTVTLSREPESAAELSYVWGCDKNLQSVKSNLKSFEESVLFFGQILRVIPQFHSDF